MGLILTKSNTIIVTKQVKDIIAYNYITKEYENLDKYTNNYLRRHSLPARRGNTIRNWNKNKNRIL